MLTKLLLSKNGSYPQSHETRKKHDGMFPLSPEHLIPDLARHRIPNMGAVEALYIFDEHKYSTLAPCTCTEAKSPAVTLYSNMSTPADLPPQQFSSPCTSHCHLLAPRSSTCPTHYLQSFYSPSSRTVSSSSALPLQTPNRSSSSNSSTESQTC